MVDEMDNMDAVRSAMTLTKISWRKAPIVQTNLVVNYFQNGQMCFCNQTYTVKFILDSNWYKVDIDDFTSMGCRDFLSETS